MLCCVVLKKKNIQATVRSAILYCFVLLLFFFLRSVRKKAHDFIKFIIFFAKQKQKRNTKFMLMVLSEHINSKYWVSVSLLLHDFRFKARIGFFLSCISFSFFHLHISIYWRLFNWLLFFLNAIRIYYFGSGIKIAFQHLFVQRKCKRNLNSMMCEGERQKSCVCISQTNKSSTGLNTGIITFHHCHVLLFLFVKLYARSLPPSLSLSTSFWKIIVKSMFYALYTHLTIYCVYAITIIVHTHWVTEHVQLHAYVLCVHMHRWYKQRVQ